MFHAAFGHWVIPSVGRRGLFLTFAALCLLAAFCFGGLTPKSAAAAPPEPAGASPSTAAQLQLQAAGKGSVTVSRHPTTGAVHFVQVGPAGDLYPALTYAQPPTTAQLAAKSDRFFADYGALFSLSHSGEVRLAAVHTDA